MRKPTTARDGRGDIEWVLCRRWGLQGSMMQCGLTLTSFLERAGRLYPKVEVVSRLPDNSLRRSTYADLYHRARALASSLQKAGIGQGDRVATSCGTTPCIWRRTLASQRRAS
jgi:acyl-coenzyme A synthetase/AMP-(fatty) acid ligase